MKIVYAADHAEHNPQSFVANGRSVQPVERPERVDMILAAVTRDGHEVTAAGEFGDAIIRRIHSDRYLDFLANGYDEWRHVPNAGPEIVPSKFANRYASRYPEHIVGRAGYHMANAACPIGPGTWKAARSSANAALSLAGILNSGSAHAYALSRPPGHHACSDMAWGFCYLNNIALLAQSLLDSGANRVAIVDIDLHHGNGTQQIFYNRRDVLTISVHADPNHFAPYFTGYADETGAGEGEGFNANLPLPVGSDDDAYLGALQTALKMAEQFGADAMLVALGVDVHEHDPLKGFSVTSDGIRNAGALLGRFRGPIGIVQEGGYPSPELGANVASFLLGLAMVHD